MNDYRDHAYERSIVATLQRILLDRFIRSDSDAKEQIVCEDMPRGESLVPQEHLVKALNRLQSWENHVRQKMNTVSPPPFVLEELAEDAATATEAPVTKTPAPAVESGSKRKRKVSGK